MDNIQQGETYSFAFNLSGESVEAFTGTFKVLQYPGDTPATSGTLTYDDGQFKGTISSATTTGLAVGQWFIYGTLDDPDESIREPIKFYVSKGW